MFTLIHLLKSLFARSEPALHHDEAYLAESVDIPDLGRRMRALDDRARNPWSGITLGLYNR